MENYNMMRKDYDREKQKVQNDDMEGTSPKERGQEEKRFLSNSTLRVRTVGRGSSGLAAVAEFPFSCETGEKHILWDWMLCR